MIDPQELLALQRRRKLADALLQNGMESGPATPLQALARVFQAYAGNQVGSEADAGIKNYQAGMDQDRSRVLGEYLTKMQGSPGVEPMTPNDDQGNPMPSSPPVAPDPRGAMATLLGAKDPALQQAGLSRLLTPPKDDEPFTLKPGESRFGTGGRVVATLPALDKPEGPKLGQLRSITKGGMEEQQEWDGSQWQKVGGGPRWQPPQGDGTPKAPPGYRWSGDGQKLEAIPGGPATPKPNEQYLKQQTGVENVRGAITEYREALKNYSPAQLINPEARAKMGTVYNNMLLQAKEAYNLGVLNGPDYMILQSVVTDPMSLKGALSRGSLDDQAKKLDALMEKIGKTSARVHQQTPTGGFTYLGKE